MSASRQKRSVEKTTILLSFALHFRGDAEGASRQKRSFLQTCRLTLWAQALQEIQLGFQPAVRYAFNVRGRRSRHDRVFAWSLVPGSGRLRNLRICGRSRYSGLLLPARLCAARKASDFVRHRNRRGLPRRLRGVERVILGCGAPERVESDESRHLLQMTSREAQTCSKSASDPLATRKRFMAMNMEISRQLDGATNICRRTIGKIAVMGLGSMTSRPRRSSCFAGCLAKIRPVGSTRASPMPGRSAPGHRGAAPDRVTTSPRRRRRPAHRLRRSRHECRRRRR